MSKALIFFFFSTFRPKLYNLIKKVAISQEKYQSKNLSQRLCNKFVFLLVKISLQKESSKTFVENTHLDNRGQSTFQVLSTFQGQFTFQVLSKSTCFPYLSRTIQEQFSNKLPSVYLIQDLTSAVCVVYFVLYGNCNEIVMNQA